MQKALSMFALLGIFALGACAVDADEPRDPEREDATSSSDESALKKATLGNSCKVASDCRGGGLVACANGGPGYTVPSCVANQCRYTPVCPDNDQ